MTDRHPEPRAEVRTGAAAPVALRPDSGGFALPVVILLLVALTLLAQGGAALLRAELLAARAGGLGLRARLHAESAVRRAAVGRLPPLPPAGAVAPISELRPARDVAVSVRGRRLGVEWVLLEGTARAESGGLRAVRTRGRVYWQLDPVSRLAAVPAAVESPVPPAGAGRVDGSAVADPPPGWSSAVCAPYQIPVDSLFSTGYLSGWAPSPPAPGPLPGMAVDRIPALGMLGGREMLRRAGARPVGSVSPGPVSRFGRCDTAAVSNWGAPGDPEGPCGGRHVVAVSEGPLVVDGGEGQGVLASAGDLTLRGHQFAGFVLAGGALRLEAGARIVGAVRVAGPVVLGTESEIRASGCAVIRALAGRGVRSRLGQLLPLPGGPWIRLP